MGFRDFVRTKGKAEEDEAESEQVPREKPEFQFYRSDTLTQESIHPPSGPQTPDESHSEQQTSFTHLSPPNSPAAPVARSRRISDVFKSRPRSSGSSATIATTVSTSSPPGHGSGPSSPISSSFSPTSPTSPTFSRPGRLDRRPTISKRLSERLHISRTPPSSENVPQDLPEIVPQTTDGQPLSARRGSVQAETKRSSKPWRRSRVQVDHEDAEEIQEDKEGTESQWEQRATLLAHTANSTVSAAQSRGASRTPSPERWAAAAHTSPSRSSHEQKNSRRGSDAPPVLHFGDNFGKSFMAAANFRSSVIVMPANEAEEPQTRAVDVGTDGAGDEEKQSGDEVGPAIDANIQEAIRLHEAGDLSGSTRIFAVLADHNGANDPLSQVLYGLALRHGWGVPADPSRAITHLSAAASNAAAIESLALQAGLKKGGAAKGELVLAIFELANCFRHGWGISKDPVAAKQYYETAANLGDTDAMNEVAWCYLQGFGCKKDKEAAARYYRLAEKGGNKTLGNTWIWKEKYDPGYHKN